MTFGNYIYSDNLAQSRQALVNQLINTSDKLEAGHMKAVEAASQLKTTIANLDMNDVEDGFKQQILVDLEKTINDNIQYGNMYYALDDIIKKSGDIMSNPAVIGRLRAQQDYKAFKDDLEKRKDVPEYIKPMLLDKNKYYYEDKYNNDGKIVGGTKWEPTMRPVTHIDGISLADKAINRIKSELNSNQTVVYTDSEGNIVDPNSNDAHLSIMTSDIQGKSIEKVSYDRLLKSYIGINLNDPTVIASNEQEKEYARWARKNGIDIDYGLYLPNGIERSPRDYLIYKFENTGISAAWSKIIESHKIQSLQRGRGNNGKNIEEQDRNSYYPTNNVTGNATSGNASEYNLNGGNGKGI